ncbi:alkane 1-monooxygenase [Roseisalinus antarcticus]|nr:alkane 1-monooxygenase [Roseisalinus antarcticus]
MPYFAVAALGPVPLLAAGALWGGVWPVLALAWITAMAAVLDEAVAWVLPAGEAGAEFPRADLLSIALACGHFAVLALIVAALAGAWLVPWEKAVLFVGTGLFMGQVGNSNAHELIHRGRRGLRTLGTWVYVTMLFGHHASAHPLVHHVRVATPKDPNSARLGEGYYRFAWRAWRGSFREGLRAENQRMARAGRAWWRHSYLIYLGGAAVTLGLAGLLGGAGGVVALLALAGFAQSQLLLSDYVQHYGLVRREGADGRTEPVAERHSWNAPHWFTSAMMLNAPRHSDHHAHPARPYPNLRLTEAAPRLPRSLPVMACVALWPRLWRRVMDPRALRQREVGPLAAE